MKFQGNFSLEQKNALKALGGDASVFLTGVAGSGKSTVLSEYLIDKDPKEYPVLASTGAAAILVGGRTFHSYFGLGIGEGGVSATLERAIKNPAIRRRLKHAKTIIIDEISMLSGTQLELAETIARMLRKKPEPWGGIRVIGVGDFAQLPPIAPHGTKRDWAFQHPVWSQTGFERIELRTSKRQSDSVFANILERVRWGDVNSEVKEFLNSRVGSVPQDFKGTRLLSRKDEVEKVNLTQLERLTGKEWIQPTIFGGRPEAVESFKRHAPIPEFLRLKKGALVMFRQNDPEKRWVNGTLGIVQSFEKDEIRVELFSGREIPVEAVEFQILDGEGKIAVTAKNYPLSLAWAVTIHKAQGATLDTLHADLRRLWEPGQSYVALSRVKTSSRLSLEGWDARSIVRDPDVARFYSLDF